MERTRYPRFLDDPCVHATLFDPDGPPPQATSGPAMWSSAGLTASTPQRCFRGSITRPARSLCTLRSRGRPRTCATLDSGWWPALTGQDSHLLGRVEGFQPACPLHGFPPSPSFAWRTNPTTPGRREGCQVIDISPVGIGRIDHGNGVFEYSTYRHAPAALRNPRRRGTGTEPRGRDRGRAPADRHSSVSSTGSSSSRSATPRSRSPAISRSSSR